MLGAILGDIIGSRFEFDRGGKTKDFELFTDECSFTDDTVMTVAVAEALLDVEEGCGESFEKRVIKSMQKWGKKYPNAGYGASFYWWLREENPKPYGSYGNGSAMRVSPVGLRGLSINETCGMARSSAEVSHNHPEGLKGAEYAALVMCLGRKGFTKEEIKEFVDASGYDYEQSLDDLRKKHAHVETCMDSLPKALASFFQGNSYEDVIRNAVSLGGDTDTLAAIAGGMAEGMYEIPKEIIEEGMKFIPDDMKEVIERYYAKRYQVRRREDSSDC